MAIDATSDACWMQRALTSAACGEGRVEPNPMVGCVLVGNGANAGVLLGEGYHQKFGEAHAERAAIADAKRNGRLDKLEGATAFVTLEPCCHQGKTPPCTTALIEAGIARVVIAQLDPFAQVSGRGVAELQAAGIQVDIGVERAAAQFLNAPYLKRTLQQRPWVIAKWAMSLDGKLATRSGESQWISGEISRAAVHRLRGRVDAILIGCRTALADDPMLTARTSEPPFRTALRVVADSTLQLPFDSRLVASAKQFPVLLACGPQAPIDRIEQLRHLGCHVIQSQTEDRNRRLDELLQTLACDYSVTNLLVEGGGQLLGSLVDLRQIDQCEVFIAPKLIGGEHASSPVAGLGIGRLSECPKIHAHRVQNCGEDIHFSARLAWPT